MVNLPTSTPSSSGHGGEKGPYGLRSIGPLGPRGIWVGARRPKPPHRRDGEAAEGGGGVGLRTGARCGHQQRDGGARRRRGAFA